MLGPMNVLPNSAELPADGLHLFEAEAGDGGRFLIIRPGVTPLTGLSEADEQQEVVYLLRRRKQLVFAVPNDGDRDAPDAGKAKRTGLLPGVSDLVWVRENAPSVFIEMKRSCGTASDIRPHQAKFAADTGKRGQLAVVCFGYRAARYLINNVDAFYTYCRHINGFE